MRFTSSVDKLKYRGKHKIRLEISSETGIDT